MSLRTIIDALSVSGLCRCIGRIRSEGSRSCLRAHPTIVIILYSHSPRKESPVTTFRNRSLSWTFACLLLFAACGSDGEEV